MTCTDYYLAQVLIMRLNVHVPVNFLSQVIFVFLLFLVMVIYANEVETKEKYKLPEIKKLTTTYALFTKYQIPSN